MVFRRSLVRELTATAVALFLVLQKYFVRALTEGAVKS